MQSGTQTGANTISTIQDGGGLRMKEWWGTSEWQRYCDRLPTEIETSLGAKWPDAGVCVALDHRLAVEPQEVVLG